MRAVGPSGLVLSGACAVRRSTDAGATLGAVNVGGGDTGCGATIAATGFADPSNGLIAFTSGVVLGTTDGGVSLARRTPVPGSPTDLVSLSPTTAYATSGNGVYRTIDGGGSWTLAALTSRNLRSLTFATATTGYAVGDGGTVLKTIDGGGTWLPAPASPGNLDLSRVRCADASLCLMTTASGATIVRTPDGGATYSQVTASARPIRAIAFASATRVVAAGDGGTTVASDDGGVTWHGGGAGVGGDVFSLTAGSGAFAYGAGSQTIALTADGGETWRSVGIPTPRAIQVVAFSDPQTGFVQDDGGTLRRTVNGGTSWQILDPGVAAGPLRGIVALSPSRVLLITAGGVARSADGGNTFAPVRSAVLRRSKVIRRGFISASGAGKRVFIVGTAGLLVSTDAGATWTARSVPRVGRRAPVIVRGDCLAPSTCWVVTSGPRVYRTTNLGRRWTDVTSAVGAPLHASTQIVAAGPREALITFTHVPAYGLADPGLVLHTADGGTSWDQQLVASTSIAVADAVAGRAWALNGPGRVYTTTTGGRTAVPSTLTISASRKVIRRAATVTVTGRLKGATGGEPVTLYATGFAARELTVSSGGTFTATYRLKRTTTLVAQWPGDGVRTGDGTTALRIVRR